MAVATATTAPCMPRLSDGESSPVGREDEWQWRSPDEDNEGNGEAMLTRDGTGRMRQPARRAVGVGFSASG